MWRQKKVYCIFWFSPECQGFHHFIGVADCPETAEEMIKRDMKNVRTERDEYVIAGRYINDLWARAIEKTELTKDDGALI